MTLTFDVEVHTEAWGFGVGVGKVMFGGTGIAATFLCITVGVTFHWGR